MGGMGTAGRIAQRALASIGLVTVGVGVAGVLVYKKLSKSKVLSADCLYTATTREPRP